MGLVKCVIKNMINLPPTKIWRRNWKRATIFRVHCWHLSLFILKLNEKKMLLEMWGSFLKGKNLRSPPPKPCPNEKLWTQFILNLCISPLKITITFRALSSPTPRFIANIVVLRQFLGGKTLFLINFGVHDSKAACRAYALFCPGNPRTNCRILSQPPPNDKKNWV